MNRLTRELIHQGLMCATAESCTGGWIAQVLTSVPGSSDWFECGFVTYSNRSKCDLLGIDASLITRHGAVSEEVARAMARGAVTRSTAQVAIAVTGIAGPDGGTPSKPVGTVALAWMLPGADGLYSETNRYDGGREAVRWASVVRGLSGLYERLS